jgi:YVTN family beta-propeller protein
VLVLGAARRRASIGPVKRVLVAWASVAVLLGVGAPVAPAASRPPVQAPALPGAQPISGRDRVYTADQTSNTVSVIDPQRNRVLGTIRLGQERLDQILGPLDRSQVNVHGLGFSPHGRLLDVISITSNAAQFIRTRTNAARRTSYVGRAPHEGFVSPDGRTLWVAVRGQRHVSVLSVRTGREVDRLAMADGPSKVVFSPGGRLAYVNHVRASVVTVVRVRDRRVIHRIRGVAPGSSDEAISPDGRELWLGHPFVGKTSVVDARRFRVLAILDSGPRTNHPNFVSKPGGRFAYVTVGGLDQTLVYRRGGAHPRLVKRIEHAGHAPHGIWPSPDNSRIYVAMQKSDAVDVIDTASDTVVATLRVGQDPMALVYVAGAVPRGDGRRGLTHQGLDRRVETLTVDVRGSSGSAMVTVRQGKGVDLLDFAARQLPARAALTAYGFRSDGSAARLLDSQANRRGDVDQALAFTDFFGVYERVVLVPRGAPPPTARLAFAPVTGATPFICRLDGRPR